MGPWVQAPVVSKTENNKEKDMSLLLHKRVLFQWNSHHIYNKFYYFILLVEFEKNHGEK
jgi:hypothetical protein